MIKFFPSKEKSLYKMFKERTDIITANGSFPLNSMAAFFGFGLHLMNKEMALISEVNPNRSILERNDFKTQHYLETKLTDLKKELASLGGFVIPFLEYEGLLLDYEEDEDETGHPGMEVTYRILGPEGSHQDVGITIFTFIPFTDENKENIITVLEGIELAGGRFKMNDRFFDEKIYREGDFIVLEGSGSAVSFPYNKITSYSINLDYDEGVDLGINHHELFKRMTAIDYISEYGRFGFAPFLLGFCIEGGYIDEEAEVSRKMFVLATQEEMMNLSKPTPQEPKGHYVLSNWEYLR